MSAATRLLGPEGPLACSMQRYEARQGQLLMAEAVEAALEDERILFCEAGTGTGKTLAYLVPAVLSGKKVIVSTATRALQEQIFFKDLPLVARALGRQPHAALMKGLANYLCRRRFEAFRTSSEAASVTHARTLPLVENWARETETGDLAELAGLSENDPLLASVGSSSETRVGASCVYFDDCFVTRMKREAEAARIVVVNHHLFFADLALRGPHPGRVLPNYDAVIFDEAHQLEDIATSFFGVRLSRTRFDRFIQDLRRTLGAAGFADPLLSRGGASALVSAAESASRIFWDAIAEQLGTGSGRTVVERDLWNGTVQERYHRLDDTLAALESMAESEAGRLATPDPSARAAAQHVLDGLDIAGRRARGLREDARVIVDGSPGRVTWFEHGQRPALSSSPVDVSQIFRAQLFETVPTVVLTSATLACGPSAGPDRRRSGGDETESSEAASSQGAPSGPFAFLRSRLGVEDDELGVRELCVESPFDFESRALLYVPDDLPEPGSPAFTGPAVDRIAELVEITDGGAFVLVTSLRSMRALHAGLRTKVSGRRLLIQGSASKAGLIAAFKSDKRAILVATMSFWQGVDVPGRALRLVVIDKIPFPVPSDPVVTARAAAIEEAGGRPFTDFHVPLAQITLKQGFGRLVRTREDFGVVALLDGRVHRRGYGRRVLSALPPAPVERELAGVREFWERASGQNA